jgi:hypothetical protein
MRVAKVLPDTARANRPLRCAALVGIALLTGYGRAPSFEILGSYFPAWLLCLVAGLLFATIVSWFFVRYRWDKNVPWGIVVYPCLAAFFTFTLWLIFFA